MNVIDKINEYLKESDDDGNKSIDWKKVKESALNAAKDIFDKVDQKIIDDMISKVKSSKKAGDTEDAIQIIINMMRAD